MPAELDIIVKATVDQATQGLITVQKNLANTSIAAGKLDSSLQKTSKTTATAGFAVQNLGRVLQDLPFGFIGIANNLNPLLESFQRLQKESKDTGTSLVKNLLGSLTGAGGIGLALSAVTAAASLASFGFSAWTRGMGGTKKATEESTKAVNEYAEAIKRATSDVAKEAGQVGLLAAVLTRSNISYEEKKKALEKLTSISSEYFGSLNTEKNLIEALAISYKLYIDNLVASLKSKAAENQIELLNAKLVTTSQKLDELSSRFANKQTFGGLANADKVNEILNKSVRTYDDILTLSKLTGQSETQIKTNLLQRNNLLFAQTRLLNQIQELTNSISTKDLLKGLNIDTGVKDKIDSITKILKELALTRINILADVDIPDLEKPMLQIEAIQKAIEKLKDLHASPEIILKLETDIGDLSLAAVGNELNKRFKTLDKFKLDIPVPVRVKPVFDDKSFGGDFSKRMEELQKDLADAAKLGVKVPVNVMNLFSIDGKGIKEFHKQVDDARSTLEKFNSDVTKLAQDTAASLAVAFGEGLGDALSGKGFDSLFKNIFGVIGGALKALGAQMIALSPVILAIKAALSSLNPVLLLPAGIALEVIGTLITNAFSKVASFGEGGIVTSPVLGLIGERGKEAVIPLERLNDYITPRNEQNGFVASTRISGQDLIILIERGKRHNGRTY